LAALFSIVEYRAIPRWISHGPEALLEAANETSRLTSVVQTKPSHFPSTQSFHLFSAAGWMFSALPQNPLAIMVENGRIGSEAGGDGAQIAVVA
jgi:hypothetical protein